jgi:MYXO-CTERM domain-containing protein
MPATPVCIPASATCGCAKDSDCNADSYCDTATVQTGTCKTGCRVMNGMSNCATGEYCSKMDGSLGTCMTEPCNQNSDCKAPTGVCDTIVQPHGCVQCLNDPDCPMGQVCDAMNHCAQCTPKQQQPCMNNPNGSVCLAASETCGCMMDSDCGNASSGMVCDMSTNKCTSGCRGTGGNGCPAGQMCTSMDGTIGTCQAASTSSASSSSSASGAGTGGAGGGGGVQAGGSGAGGGHVVSQSAGCGCRVGAGDDEERLAPLAFLVGIGLLLRRRPRARAMQ